MSELLWLVAWLIAPRVLTCPPPTYAEGVRPTGETWCVEPPRRLDCGEPPQLDCPDGARFPVRVWCKRETEIAVLDADGATIRCVSIARVRLRPAIED